MYNTERSEISHDIYDDVMTRNEDREERVEMMVDIYDSVDTVRHHDPRTHTEKHQPLQQPGSVSVKNRKHRAAEVCLCLLCFLLLTAVIVLCVCFISERKQLLTHISNLTEEREKTLTKYEQILNHNNNLTEEREKTLTKYEQILNHNNNLTEEREKTLTKYEQILNHNNNLTEEREKTLTKYEQTLNHNDKLTEEREKLKNDTNQLHTWLYEQDLRADNFKWIYYNFSFYYISSERKSWSYSRQDCRQRGADLVIIDSQGEQDFLQKIADIDNFWIGLKKMEGVWKWHDGATVVNGYWRSQYPRSNSLYCALMTSSGWTDESCFYQTKWICKKTFFFKSLITLNMYMQ